MIFVRKQQPLKLALLLLAIQCTVLPRLCQEVQVQSQEQPAGHSDEALHALYSNQYSAEEGGDAVNDSGGSLVRGSQEQAPQHHSSNAASAVDTAARESAAEQQTTTGAPSVIPDAAFESNVQGIPLPVQPAPGLDSSSLGCMPLHSLLVRDHPREVPEF